MLWALTASTLAVGVVLGVLLDWNSWLASFFIGLGVLLSLFTVVVTVLSLFLPLLGESTPVAGNWGPLLGDYVDGVYGFPGWYFVLASIFLLLITVAQFTELDEAGTNGPGETEEPKRERATDSDQKLTDVSGIEPHYADQLERAGFEDPDNLRTASKSELTAVEGIDTALANRIKSDAADIDRVHAEKNPKEQTESDAETDNARHSEPDRVQAEPVTSISGVGTEQATELKEAGYTTVEEIRAASQSELVEVVGAGLASRIKTDVGSIDETESSKAGTLSDGVEELTAQTGLAEAKCELLYEAGYRTSEDLEAATFEELSRELGHDVAVAVRDEAGLSASKYTTEDEPSTIDSTSEGDDLERETDPQTVSGATTSARETVQDEREVSGRLEELEQRVESQLDGVTSQAFEDPESTRKQLVRGHTTCVALAEEAAEYGANDVFERTEETLDEVETQLETLPRITDALQSARERAPIDDGSLNSVQRPSLETSRDFYETALDAAEEAGFETAQIDREYDQVVAEFERRNREELLGVVTEVADELDRLPKPEDVVERRETDTLEYQELFDSWAETLRAADIDVESQIVRDLRRVEENIDEDLNKNTYQRAGKHDLSQIQAHVGSWGGALRAAFGAERISIDDSGVAYIDRRSDSERCIEAIRDVAESLDRPLKPADINQQTDFSVLDISRNVGSWQKALEKAGVDNSSRLLEELRRVAEVVGHPPSESEVDQHGHVNAGMYEDYFESLAAAVDQALGDGWDEKTDQQTRDEYIEAIRRVAASLDRPVKSTDVSQQTEFSFQEVVQEFGSWQDALAAADVDNQSRLIDEIQRVAEEIGHRPSPAEMDNHGYVNATFYTTYFEEYTDAVDRAFSDRNEESPTAADSSADTDEFDIDRSIVTIREITEDRRLTRSIAVKVCNISEKTGEKKQARLLVEDPEGMQCRLNIWQKHSLQFDSWRVGHWYLLTEARGKYWPKGDDDHGHLSSTRDLQVTHLGTELSDSTIDPNVYPDESSSPDTGKKSNDNANKSTHPVDDPSEEDLIDAISQLANELDRTPSLNEMHTEGAYNRGVFYSRFESWNQAVEKAGLEPNNLHGKIPTDKLENELERLANQLGHPPTPHQLNELGEYSSQTYNNRYQSWEAALIGAGLDPQKMPSKSTEGPDFTREELVSELQRLAEKLNKTPSMTEMDESGKYSSHDYYECFDTWNDAIQEVGLTPNSTRSSTDSVSSSSESSNNVTTTPPDSSRNNDAVSAQTNVSEKNLDSLPHRIQSRLVDIIRLEPTDSWELQEEWEFDNRGEVKQYLWSKLIDYYERDEEQRIRPTDEVKNWFHNRNHMQEEPSEADTHLETSQTGTQTNDSSQSKLISEQGSRESEATSNPDTDEREDIINKIRQTAKSSRGTPSRLEIQENTQIEDEIVKSEFGNWYNAIRAAKVETTDNTQDSQLVYSKDDIIDAIQSLADELGRAPSQTEMNERGKMSTTTAANRFGSWSQALEAAGVRTNDSSESESEESAAALETEPSGSEETDESDSDYSTLIDEELDDIL